MKSIILTALGLLGLAAGSKMPPKYLFISAPRMARVMYLQLPGPSKPKALIDSGLRSPQGLAVDRNRKILYVADPSEQKVLAYDLIIEDGEVSVDAGNRRVMAENVEPRWVTVDGAGNIFFTDERDNAVMMVTQASVKQGKPNFLALYSATNIPQVSGPGGILADNFHLYWTNKAVGSSVGSVVQALETPPDVNNGASVVHSLTHNANKVYGVCMAQNNIFYTNAQKIIYGVKKNGGEPEQVSDKLTEPRGCVWDGDGTVYVADKGDNSIYSFAGNMKTIRQAPLTKVADFEDAFGLALMNGVSGLSAPLLLLFGLLFLS